MKIGARLAAVTFGVVWVPITLWRGITVGRSSRIGAQGQEAVGPIVEGVLQAGAVALVPSLFAALITFVLWAWQHERSLHHSTRRAQ